VRPVIARFAFALSALLLAALWSGDSRAEAAPAPCSAKEAPCMTSIPEHPVRAPDADHKTKAAEPTQRPAIEGHTEADSTVQPSLAANQIKWRFMNSTGYLLQVQVYAPARHWVWPNATTAWYMANGSSGYAIINCKRGEKVCFGAWTTENPNIYWGVGYKAQHSCPNCCWICKGVTTPIINFRP
jgi:hypothetical protein